MSTAIPPSDRTLVDIIRERATRTPRRQALVFLDDAAEPVTYAQLDLDARSLAAALLQNAGPGDRALILLPPGRAYVAAFLACLYAGVVAVPQYPPTSRRGSGSVLRTAVDAGTVVAVSDAAGRRTMTESHPELAALPLTWVVVEDVPAAASVVSCWQGPDLDALALLQYTSGSTGTPKGVMVRHHHLTHSSAIIAKAIGAHPGSRSVSWLPPYHDMGLIGGILQPLYSGFTGMLMSPMAFLRDPSRWLATISRYRASLAVAPDFGYLECVRRVSEAAAAALDLSCWEHAMIGAEPIRPSTLDAFSAKFEPHGFRRSAFHPCYGLAEATLFVTGGRGEDGQATRVVTLDRAALRSGVAREVGGDVTLQAGTRVTACGRPLSQDRVVVVEPETMRLCVDEQVGEILVSGPTVAAGYWGGTDTGTDDFSTAVPGLPGRFLRTRDRGFLLDGELFVTGRVKDLIIVAGRNYSPHDLEMTGESAHPAIAPGRSAAFAADIDGAERVVLVHEVVRGFHVPDVAPVIDAVVKAVTTGHGIAPHEVLLTRSGRVPTTSSGKVRRSRCRELWLAGELAALPPVTKPGPTSALAPPPDHIAAAVADLLRRALPVSDDSLAPDVPLVSLGLDSLRAVMLAQAMQETFGAAPELTALLGELTPRGLTEWSRTAPPRPVPLAVDAGAGVAQPSVWAASRRQEWLWLLDRMGAGPAYTIVGGVRLRGAVEVARLREAVDDVLGGHPALRTTFTLDSGTLLATLHPQRPVSLSVEDVSGQPGRDAATVVAALAQDGFDLATGPLLRAVLVRAGEQEWTLGVAVHHIAVDGWSLAVLLDEVGRAYHSGGRTTDRLTGTPVGFEGAQPTAADTEFWRSNLRGACAVALPLDRPIPEHRSWRGSSGALNVSADLTKKVRRLASDRQATPFMVVLTALTAVLARRTGQTDLVVGTTTARREAADTDRVGLFVNTIPIRIDASGDPTFVELLDRVRTSSLTAYAHRHLPYEQILETAETLDPPGPRAPLLRVCLSFQNLPLERWQVAGLAAEPFELPAPGAQFELGINLTEQTDGSLSGHTVHAADLFDVLTIAEVREELVAVLSAAVSGDERPLAPPTSSQHTGLSAQSPAGTVVIGGFGVSPERIAWLLRRHPSVAKATVRVESAGPVATLVAELTSAEGTEPVPDVVLRSLLSADLPGVAIPFDYRWASQPAPFELVSLTALEPAARVDARDDLEAELAAIWCDVIGLSEVSMDTAFFELGGHSLQAARIVARVETTFGVRVRVEEVLTAETTIEKLAAIVRDLRAHAEDPEVDRAVAALGQLSEEEIAELLKEDGS